MRILIVEDEFLIRECLSRVAQSKGHTVKAEKSGKAGLKTWKAFQPHLIFLDILIPEIDGPSLLELVGKKNNEKVIMMSRSQRAFTAFYVWRRFIYTKTLLQY